MRPQSETAKLELCIVPNFPHVSPARHLGIRNETDLCYGSVAGINMISNL